MGHTKGDINRLSRFYGDVAAYQNRDIIKLITGKRILDIGCGYGFLVRQICDEIKGIDITGIDIDRGVLETGRHRYGVDVKYGSVYKLDFPDGSFDTVVLREAVHHFGLSGDMGLAMKEIRRVCSVELIILDPNPTWIVKMARRIAGHDDEEVSPELLSRILEENGFSVKRVEWRDVLAFPVSGAFVGPDLVPNIAFVKKAIIGIDRCMNSVLKFLRLQRFFCWRYIVYAVKKEEGL